MDTKLNTCRAGHNSHERIRCEIELDGQPAVPDFPAIPEHLAQRFPFHVFNEGIYSDYPDYCTGKDELSRSISTQGIWEGWVSLLALDLFNQGPAGRFVDFGSHVGWYTILAGLNGWTVEAYEADAENIELLKLNAAESGVEVETKHTWIDEDLPKVTAADIIKVDLEGLDHHAVEACGDLFERQEIRAALVEISPYLAAGIYPDLCERIAGCGYTVHQIPDKGGPQAEFTKDPLGTTTKHRIKNWRQIENLRQENFLFLRKG